MRASKFLKALANDNRLVILCSLAETRRDSRQIYYGLASEEAKQMIELLYKLFRSKSEEDAVAGGDETTVA